ncbi:hypothetical protein HZH68_005493 [Vespula germanica]|uniref:Uncharacterized protein n=1 Tax=Vespula germanica TaxID=30212 RepID=A0A834KJT5_VESGE|nr:hypothetical protein HZH68_005493 [Vespula germanica]
MKKRRIDEVRMERVRKKEKGYLGGIVDGRLDVPKDARRANVTAFIDFTSSKTCLYSLPLQYETPAQENRLLL